jgi:hypothetical protein
LGGGSGVCFKIDLVGGYIAELTLLTMSTESGASGIITFDENIKQDSPVPEEQSEDLLGETAISEIQCYLRKYSTTSTVFAEQSITNPDYQRTLYWCDVDVDFFIFVLLSDIVTFFVV